MIGQQQYKALCFICDNPDCYAAELAMHLWGDNKAAPAGAINGKLATAGLTSGRSGSMRITNDGRQAILEYEEVHPAEVAALWD